MANRVFIYDTLEGKIALNIDNEYDCNEILKKGARELTKEEIKKYGMEGYENLVSLVNTKVNEDGTITFIPPSKEEFEEPYIVAFNMKRLDLLNATDYLIMPDYPIDENKKEKVKAYRQYLRDMTKLPDYPFINKPIPWPKKDW